MKNKLEELKKMIAMTQAKYQMPQDQRIDLIKKKLLTDYFIIDLEIVRSLLYKKDEAEAILDDLKDINGNKEYILFHEKDQPLILASKNYFTQIHQYFSTRLKESFWITPGRLYRFVVNEHCKNELKKEEGQAYLNELKSKVEVCHKA
jgi:hypothetical protein